MLQTIFSFSCTLEPEGGNNKVVNYAMSGNITAQMASNLLQQLMILEAVKKAQDDNNSKKPVKEKTLDKG